MNRAHSQDEDRRLKEVVIENTTPGFAELALELGMGLGLGGRPEQNNPV